MSTLQKRILISPNAFKYSLSAIEVAKTIKSTLDSLNLNLSCELAPIADGGDGTLEIFKYYFKNSKYVKCIVHDPLMRKINTKWLLLKKNIAVIELAKGSGLSLLRKSELNPLKTTTYGTGELILNALNYGCRKIIIALGGSATVDAGLGILQALGAKYYDKKGNLIKPVGASLPYLNKIDLTKLNKKLRKCKIEVLCDVNNPLIGKYGTVKFFSRQKGATQKDMKYLEEGMKNIAQVVKEISGTYHCFDPMSGSAGGVAFFLKSIINANLYPGFIYISKFINLEMLIKNSYAVISGEGNLDIQSTYGKGLIGLSLIAKKHKKKVVVFCGGYNRKVNYEKYGISHIFQIRPPGISLEKSLRKSKIYLKNSIKKHYRVLFNY